MAVEVTGARCRDALGGVEVGSVTSLVQRQHVTGSGRRAGCGSEKRVGAEGRAEAGDRISWVPRAGEPACGRGIRMLVGDARMD